MEQLEPRNEYRSERKERLNKNAKKKSKKRFDSTRLVGGIIIAVLVVAVLAAIGGGLYAYGVPQRLMTAVTIDGRDISVAEYSYYYTSVYNNYVNNVQSYEQQLGVSLGYDYTKDPAAQTTTDEDGNTITYADYFKKSVIASLQQNEYYLKEAKAAGMELSDENKKDIDDALEQLATTAKTYGYSTVRYLNMLYGKGVTVDMFRTILEEQSLVSQYTDKLTSDEEAAVTMADIEAKYNEAPDDYKAVDLRLFGLEISAEEADLKDTTSTDTNKQSKQELLLNEMCEKVTDEASFVELAEEYCADIDKETFKNDSATLATGVTKSVITSNFSEDLAKWLFSADRKIGDKKVVVTDTYVYLVMLRKLAYRNEDPLVSARHILVSFDTVASELEKNKDTKTKTDKIDGVDYSNTKYEVAVINAAYEQAQTILEEYNNGEKTENAFAALAETYSDDTASTSAGGQGVEGGLYSDIVKGEMVAAFENWVYDSSRKTGDVGIVQTEYGFHIMYFVSRHTEAPWIETIRSSIASEQSQARSDKVTEATKGNAQSGKFEGFAVKEALKVINKVYVSSAAAEY